jgi:hypothetical protein
MKALLATAAVVLAVGCGGPAAPHQHNPVTASASASLTSFDACRQLRDDIARNGGSPDIPTLRHIADHVIAPRMAGDARTAVRDIGHTGIAPVALALLRADCAQAGVQIPAP